MNKLRQYMKNANKVIILFYLLFISFTSEAQSPKKLEKEGDKAFKLQNYASSTYLYDKAIQQNQAIKLAYKLAESARYNRDYKLAEKWYLFAAEKKSKDYPLAYFHLASVQKSMGNYQKAQINFRNSYHQLKKAGNYYELKSKHEIHSCENALFLTFEPTDENFTRLDTNFNGEYSEFQLLQINDTSRWISVLRPDDSPDTLHLLSRIVSYKGDSTNNWKKQGFIKINEFFPDKHISSFTIDTSLKIIIVSVCETNTNGFDCNLWQLTYNKNDFSSPEKMNDDINAIGYSTTHPNFAQVNENKYLLFSSDRSGGEGKMDIFYCPVSLQGDFGKPINPGKIINTIDDEVSPFYDSNKKILYFSSEWFTNLGGLDIFKISTNFVSWGFVENIGYPINSSYHDLFYSNSINNDFAFLSSNKPLDPGNVSPGCCNDIYAKPLPKITNDSLILAKRVIQIQKKTRQLIPLSLFFHNDEPNPKTWDTTTTLNYQQCFDSYMALNQEYQKQWVSNLKEVQAEKASEQIESFFLDSVETNFQKFKLFADYMIELLDNGKNIEITIKGYASPLNTSDYNANLSKRRIQSLYIFLYEYKQGILVKYINGKSEKGNSLIIHRQAFGKEKAASNVSGNINDLRNSVYSPQAANERKVAVIAVEF